MREESFSVKIIVFLVGVILAGGSWWCTVVYGKVQDASDRVIRLEAHYEAIQQSLARIEYSMNNRGFAKIEP